MSDPDTSPEILPPHEIIVVPPPGHEGRRLLLDQCINVRIDVFIREQQFPLDEEVDKQDPTATHFLLRLVPSLTPIGTIRAYRVEGGNYYKLSRLAVLKPYRQYHCGRDLVLALHRWVKDDAKRIGAMQVTKVVCHSQLPVKGFYSKYGYQPEVIFPLPHGYRYVLILREQGDEFDEDGAPHQKMVAYLSS
ncbi:acyl-CoA N-acyltransferase [Lanmaoa asiatica]|nr:acyl-CoA N-acyltransferase [Lanmaoa asiatica]